MYLDQSKYPEKKHQKPSKELRNTHCSKSLSFVQKFNFDFPRKNVELFWVKSRENAAVLDFLAVENFNFTRKIVKNILGEKLVKMLGIGFALFSC